MLDVKLVVVGGANEGDEFQLELPAVLGRGREATLPLPHPLVSRLHCELAEVDGNLVVRDLGSTNGTFVGSERVEESPLANGQLLTIGTVTFRAFLGAAQVDLGCVPEAMVPVTADAHALEIHAETATIAAAETTHLAASKRPVQKAK